MDPVQSLLTLAELPATDAHLAAADRELGRALLWVGQDYLARVSDEWDVELFFEVYNKPPSTGGWAQAIITGLEKRPDISADDRSEIVQSAQNRALPRLKDGADTP
ncbi:hypothetical protein [Rhodococcus sp. NCIMB 12038]|uniref:hypothetical protein n=1 Tax=Rhodococcus sp. NCIMB 12038 TaxID=933800 RepID=UPI00117BD658|nr:hypothetical protein [Rhodococcus sp. NCIMB 12038]